MLLSWSKSHPPAMKKYFAVCALLGLTLAGAVYAARSEPEPAIRLCSCPKTPDYSSDSPDINVFGIQKYAGDSNGAIGISYREKVAERHGIAGKTVSLCFYERGPD
jgi:hypothetical protein